MKRQTNTNEMKVSRRRWNKKKLQFVTVQSTKNRIKQYRTFNDVVWESTTDSFNNNNKRVSRIDLVFFFSRVPIKLEVMINIRRKKQFWNLKCVKQFEFLFICRNKAVFLSSDLKGNSVLSYTDWTLCLFIFFTFFNCLKWTKE